MSLIHDESLSGIVAVIKTMDEEKATWDYVTRRLLEEHRTQRLVNDADLRGKTVHTDELR